MSVRGKLVTRGGDWVMMLAVGLEQTKCHVLRNFDGLLDGSPLGYQTGLLVGCGEVAATLHLFNMQAHNEFRHGLMPSRPPAVDTIPPGVVQ